MKGIEPSRPEAAKTKMRGCAEDRALERVKGIEPSPKAWEAFVLPLNYTRERPGPREPAPPSRGHGKHLARTRRPQKLRGLKALVAARGKHLILPGALLGFHGARWHA